MSQPNLDYVKDAVKLTGITTETVEKLRDIRCVTGYADLHKTATKIQHKILEERKCWTGKLKFAIFPEKLLFWSLRRSSGMSELIQEFKRGLVDIHNRATDQNIKGDIENLFQSIGESIPEASPKADETSHSVAGDSTISETADDSIKCIESFLYGKGYPVDSNLQVKAPLIRRDATIEPAFTRLGITLVDGVDGLTQDHLKCINNNKQIVVLEGNSAFLIRKNEEGKIEITKFTTMPKTLWANGGVQMDSGDYVNAFQLFVLKHKFDDNAPADSLKKIQDDLCQILAAVAKPREVPREKMFLIKSIGMMSTTPQSELLHVLQYAAKGNPAQETSVAQFEMDRYVEHLSNLVSKMASEKGATLDQYMVVFNALSKDIRQRILLLQASGKISTDLASQYLSQIDRAVATKEKNLADPSAIVPSSCPDANGDHMDTIYTEYTRDANVQASSGHNVHVSGNIPKFLKQTNQCSIGSKLVAARLTMGFAAAKKFEELIEDPASTIAALKGKDSTETKANIGNFFRMAVLHTEYCKRNGIIIPEGNPEFYDKLVKLGADIYTTYGEECKFFQEPEAGEHLLNICEALKKEEIKDFQGAKQLLDEDPGYKDCAYGNIVRKFVFAPNNNNRDQTLLTSIINIQANHGFTYMLLSLVESSKDGTAFIRQDSCDPVTIKNSSFAEQLQDNFKAICSFLSNKAQGEIARSREAKRFPFLEHCFLSLNVNVVQKAEAMLSWLQTSGNTSIFDDIEAQRMFCKLLCGDSNNPQALSVALEDPATREQFVRIANQFFKTTLEHLPNPIAKDEDIQKYNFYASLYIQLNKTIEDAGGGALDASVFKRDISQDDSANEVQKFACVLLQKMISGEKLTAEEILMCTDPKMMIWPEMAGASDTLLERDPEDSSGIKNMFEGPVLESLRDFIVERKDQLEGEDYNNIAKQYARQLGYGDDATIDVNLENRIITINRTITIDGVETNSTTSIDLNNFVRLRDGIHPMECVETKEVEHPILAQLGINSTNINHRVKVEGDISIVDGKITIDNKTNKVTMDNMVFVTKVLQPGTKITPEEEILAPFLPFVGEDDTACKTIYFYDRMSLDKPIFMLKGGKLYTQDDKEYHNATIAFGAGTGYGYADPRLKMIPFITTKVLATKGDDNKVSSYVIPSLHYDNKILQFNRGKDGQLHLASNENYILSEPPVPNPLIENKDLHYICLRSKDNPNDYKFILINDKNLFDSSSLDNAAKSKISCLGQDVLEIGFNSVTGFDPTSDSQATGIMLVKKLFEIGNYKLALDLLNKLDMREVIALGNNTLLQITLRSLITDKLTGTLKIEQGQSIEQDLVAFKMITLLLEADPYNFCNLLLVRKTDGSIDCDTSFALVSQISSLYQSLVDARENSTQQVKLSKEDELVVMEEIIGAMSQVLQSMPKVDKLLMVLMSESKKLEEMTEYGLLKLFEQRHQVLVEELGARTNAKYFTQVDKNPMDHVIVHVQPGGKCSFEKANAFSSILPTRNTEMLEKLRKEAKDTALLKTTANIERRKAFLQQCCRSDNEINDDIKLSKSQKKDYIAFRNAMRFPTSFDVDGESSKEVILNSIQEVFISEIEEFLKNQPAQSENSQALGRESNIRSIIRGSILSPVKAPQTKAPQADSSSVEPQASVGNSVDNYKISVLLDFIQQDEKTIQSNERLTSNNKQLILKFKKKYGTLIGSMDFKEEDFKEQYRLELLALADAIFGSQTFSSNDRQGITQYETTAKQEMSRYNDEMSLAGSQDLRSRVVGELYEINASSFGITEGKSGIDKTVDNLTSQIGEAQKEADETMQKLEEKFSACSKTMESMRKTALAKTPTLDDARKALACSPSDPNGDWSKSIKVLQDINPEFTIADCKEIVNLTRKLLQASTSIKFMGQLKGALENLSSKGKAVLSAGKSIPGYYDENLSSEQKEFLLAKDQLIAAYESVRTYDPEKDMEALVFEDIVGFRVRGAQSAIIKNVTAQLQANEASGEATGVTFQLMMGGGKTSVILSQLAHSISTQNKVPLFVCHPSQYTAMLGNLRLFQESRYSQEVISVDESKSDLKDPSKLSVILRKFKRAKEGGGCLVIQAPTLRAIKLEFIRTSRLAIQEGDPAVMARAKLLAEILSHVKENCVQLLDEIDLNLDISKSVNFPGGERQRLDSSQIDVIASMFDAITAEDSELYDAFCGDKFGVEKVGQTPVDAFKKKIIDKCFSLIKALDRTISEDDLKKFMLGTQEPSPEFKTAWGKIKKEHPKEASNIALQKGMLSIADSAAQKEYNRHYGFREDGAVIPYQGVGTPSSGEFGNVYEQAYYFFAAVLHDGIQKSQMTSLIERYIKGSLSKSSVEKLGLIWTDCNLGKLSDLKKMTELQRNTKIHAATLQLNANKKSKNFMSLAKMVAARTIEHNSELLECDAVSMVDMSKTSVGCTGTPWNMQTYHSAFQGENKALLELGTEGKIIQKWRKDFQTGASKILTPQSTTVSGILDSYKTEHEGNSGKLRALIDAGGVFKDKTNVEVARDILEHYKDDPNVGFVVYLGKTATGKESFFVMKKNDPDHPVPIPNTSLDTIENVVEKGNIDKVFTYFDELRCTGCDIPLSKDAQAILTVNPDTTPVRTALQGVLRARKFLDSQQVDICIPQDLVPAGLDTSSDPVGAMTKICSYCIENQSAMLAKQTYKSYRAQISNCLKGILFERLHEKISQHEGSSISRNEQEALKLCERFLYSRFEADPLKLFGGFTSEQEAFQALKGYYDGLLADIKKIDKGIIREFEARAAKILTQAEKVLKFKIQGEEIETGTEVEQEQEQERELEEEKDLEQEKVADDTKNITQEQHWTIFEPKASQGDSPATSESESAQTADAAPQASEPAKQSSEDKIPEPNAPQGDSPASESESAQTADAPQASEPAKLPLADRTQNFLGDLGGAVKLLPQLGADAADAKLRELAQKHDISDRELLEILKKTELLQQRDKLCDKVKARILEKASSFDSLMSQEGAPERLSANSCAIPKSKTGQPKSLGIFGEDVQITANLARNIEGSDWINDSQRKNPQFVLVYKSDSDETYKTLFLSDQDAQEIGKAMSNLNVKNCWMFNAGGVPASTNPLTTIDETTLAAGRRAAANLAILYGNFHHLNATQENQDILREHVQTSATVKEMFLKRVQTIQPLEYDAAKQFLRTAA